MTGDVISMRADGDPTWRQIPIVDPEYWVSEDGRLVSYKRKRPRYLSTSVSAGGDGYRRVNLRADGRSRTFGVHQLVAAAFLGVPPDGMEVRHLDGDRLNNHLSNLAYGTSSENRRDTLLHGTHPQASRTHCPAGHPYDAVNTYRNPVNGKRSCRACHTAGETVRREARRALLGRSA